MSSVYLPTPINRPKRRVRTKTPEHHNNCDGQLLAHVVWDKGSGKFYPVVKCACSAKMSRGKTGHVCYVDAHQASLKMENVQ